MKMCGSAGFLLLAVFLVGVLALPARTQETLADAERLNAQIVQLYQQGKYTEAVPLAERALAIRRRLLGPDHSEVATSLNNLAALYYAMGAYDKAEPLYRQALEIKRKALGEAHPDYARSLNNLALLYHAMGAYDKAEPFYRQALKIRRKALGEAHPDYAITLNCLAVLYEAMGAYDKAEPLYRQALEIQSKSLGEAHPDYATSLINLAGLYTAMGAYDRAEPLYRQALEIIHKALGDAHPDYATSLNNLAALYYAMGAYDKAEPLYRQALEIRRKVLGEAHPDYAQNLNNLAVLYYAMGAYDKAEPLYRQALEIRRKALGDVHPDYAASLNNLALLYKAMGAYDRAEPLYRQALEIKRKALGEAHPDYAASLNNLAGLCAAQQRWREALPLHEHALAIEQQQMHMVFGVTAENEREAYLATIRGSFDAFITTVVAQQADPQFTSRGLTWTLRRKGTLLEAALAERAAVRLAKDAETAGAWTEMTAARSTLAKLVFAGPGKEGLAAHQQRCAELEGRIDVLQKALAGKSAALGAAWTAGEVDIPKVAAALPPGSALIEIVCYTPFNFTATGKQPRWGEDQYLAFVLRAGAAEPALIPLGPAAPIDAAVNAFRQAMREVQATITARGEAAAETSLAKVAEPLLTLVWAKIEPALGGATRLYLSPDGELNLLAFGALRDGEQRYLAERYVFCYLACGRDLPRPREAAAGATLTAMGDPTFAEAAPPLQIAREAFRSAPAERGLFSSLRLAPLPGTRAECEEVAALAREHGLTPRILLGEAAGEAALKTLAPPRILHLATHGYFLADTEWARELRDTEPGLSGVDRPRKVVLSLHNPLHRSGLALAGAARAVRGEAIPDDEDDGLLTAEEAATLDLRGTLLVTLSACDTGVGEVKRGEGVFGLRRAFQMAGAQGLLMSLWRIPDQSTKELMTAFYTRFLEAGDGPAALCEAQRALIAARRADGKAAHPFYWGAFVITGAEP